MLYSLLAVNIVLCIALPLTGVFCFVKGYNLKAEKIGEKPIQLPSLPAESPSYDESLQTLLHNIENYDGTGKGQVKIDEKSI